MLTMDVFKQDAFSAISLTEAVRRSQTIPGLIGSLGLFTPKPVRTRKVAVELKGQQLNIIQTSEVGAPRTRRSNDKASIVDLRVRRLEESSQLQAEELQGMRAFGSETELRTLQTEIATRQQGLIDDLGASIERQRLSCIQGILRDADDSVIYDYYSTFGFTAPTELGFNWASRTGVEKYIATNVRLPMIRAAGGIVPPNSQIIALCGDNFFFDLKANAEYRAAFLNNANASKLLESAIFDAIDAWGITWVHYRGTDDNSKVAIPVDKARFFLRGVRGLFQEALAPAPTFGLANTLGLEWYSRILVDDDRDEWVDLEMETYRLPICTRPETLMTGRTGA